VQAADITILSMRWWGLLYFELYILHFKEAIISSSQTVICRETLELQKIFFSQSGLPENMVNAMCFSITNIILRQIHKFVFFF
jgi:hypothetical protein